MMDAENLLSVIKLLDDIFKWKNRSSRTGIISHSNGSLHMVPCRQLYIWKMAHWRLLESWKGSGLTQTMIQWMYTCAKFHQFILKIFFNFSIVRYNT